MRPLQKHLEKFENKQAIVDHFKVSNKTATRWLEFYGMNTKRANYGPKLKFKQAAAIRNAFKQGVCVKTLADQFGVTLTTIYRIVKNETHKDKDFAYVSVVYNPLYSSSSSSGGK